MKTSLVAIVLAFAISAVGQDASQQPAQSQSGAASPQASGASQSSGPVIKDPAEYNAYMAAIQQSDPNAKISGLEAFLTQYPNSVVKPDALELLLATYQQTGNEAKTLDTAQKILQANPNNVRALAILCYTYRARAMSQSATAAQDIAQAKDYGQRD